MSFGGETVDNFGVTRSFPAASMLTGLLANALGWHRTNRASHQELQDRIVFAARIDHEPTAGGILHDFQTAQLSKGDRGWTTRGYPEKREGGHTTYRSPHIRHRDYLADMIVTVALRLEPEREDLDLDMVATALQQPARPLFIGRKPCLPSSPLFEGFAEGTSALDALLGWPLSATASSDLSDSDSTVPVLWPADDDSRIVIPVHEYMITDQRNWSSSGLHGGGRRVCEGRVPRAEFPQSHTEVSVVAREQRVL